MMKNEFLNWKNLIVLVSSLALLLVSYPVFAEEQAGTSEPIQATDLIDPDELEASVDGYVSEEMETWHVPGLMVVVVQDGEVLLSKGYGYADLMIGSSGSAVVWATGSLIVKMGGSGDVNYYGTPSVEFSGKGTGDIKSLGEK